MTRRSERTSAFPDRCSAALLILDVINDLEFPGGANLLRHAAPMAERLAQFTLCISVRSTARVSTTRAPRSKARARNRSHGRAE